MRQSKINETMKLKFICEVCGKTEILTVTEGHLAGWDYPPMIGSFGVVSPRTCPDCNMMKTVWAAMAIEGKSADELTDAQKETLKRIKGEPDSILVEADGHE